ncbi:XdhC family protein [Streptomyces sp. NPDC050560]|uniref:XdhC family protein n=1 Tax=Streptomyces sp. NPDC050560 TaxID=3365630 RepID=UPI0037A06F95
MRELLPRLRALTAAAEPFALATVVTVRGSAPRLPGATMAVTREGRVIGSLSGGCVESAVYEAAQEVLDTGLAQLVTYGVSDDDAFAVGLTCGGTLEILIRPVDPRAPAWTALMTALDHHQPAALATSLAGPAPLGATLLVHGAATHGTLGADAALDRTAAQETRRALRSGITTVRRLHHCEPAADRREDTTRLFVQVLRPPARMLVFGAVDHAAATARIGAFLGYRVTVCDARPVFADAARFPDADEVVCAWPHAYLEKNEPDIDERTAICVLTHDPKFDIPLLLAAVRTGAGYIGVMGSRRTHRDREARLREAGATAADLARLASPIGLDLGASTPEETAVSIAAEIVALRHGGTGRRLTELTGAIHRDRQEAGAA